MPRQPRKFIPGTVYHLISRFVDRDWFIKSEQEREDYLRLLGRALTTSDWRCLAYAVMSNHVHLAAIAGMQPLDTWIRRVHSPFADAMNRAYDRIGPMFVRGPKALAVEPSAVGNVIAYIHNNPVRAELVDDASKSSWTSHRAYLGLARVPSWLHVDEGLALAGCDAAAFHAWVGDPARDDFAAAHEAAVRDDLVPSPRTRTADVEPTWIVTATASELGIPVAQLRSRRRSPVEITGREAVVFCAQRLGVTCVATAQALGVSQQAVSLIARRAVGVRSIELAARVLSRLEAQGVHAGVERSVSGHNL